MHQPYALNLTVGALLLLAVCACNDDTHYSNAATSTSNGTTAATSSSDTMPSNATTSNTTSPSETSPNETSSNETSSETSTRTARLVLENETSSTLWVQVGAWWMLDTSSGERIAVEDNCAVCNCEDDACDTGICGAPLSITEAIAPGQTAEAIWNGTRWRSENGACEFLERAPGSRFVAQLCWGDAIEQAGMESWVLNPTCADVTFDLAENSSVDVRHVVTEPDVALPHPPVTFVLENSSVPVWVQTQSIYRNPDWLNLRRENTEIPMNGACNWSVNNVEAQELAQGQTAEWTWNGKGECCSDGCDEEPYDIEPGTYTAIFCWGYRFNLTNNGTVVSDTTCLPQEFELGTDTTVRITIPPRPVTFVFENQTDTPVWVQTGNDIGHPTWLTIQTPSEERIRPLEDCGYPECNTTEEGTCGIAEPAVRELRFNDTVQWAWEGQAWLYDTEGDCERSTLPNGFEFAVEFCWGTDVENLIVDGDFMGGNVVDPMCRSIPFTIGTDTEVHYVLSDE